MTTQESIDQWRRLAASRSYLASQARKAGEYSGVHEAQAKLYENVARSFELGREHGEPYCCCHLRPVRVMRELDARRPPA